jgi:uncharacterized Zn finger protein
MTEAMAEQFDDDPFLSFKLRGKSKEQLISELREKRAGARAFEETTAADETELVPRQLNWSTVLEF